MDMTTTIITITVETCYGAVSQIILSIKYYRRIFSADKNGYNKGRKPQINSAEGNFSKKKIKYISIFSRGFLLVDSCSYEKEYT